MPDAPASKGTLLRTLDVPAHAAGAGGQARRRVVFQPVGTSYEHHLDLPAKSPDPALGPAHVRVAAWARKVYGVPSGGAFVVPTMGTPRVVQGRVVAIDGRTVTVRAGALFKIELPQAELAVDLHQGPIAVGSMVNCVLRPGAAVAV